MRLRTQTIQQGQNKQLIEYGVCQLAATIKPAIYCREWKIERWHGLHVAARWPLGFARSYPTVVLHSMWSSSGIESRCNVPCSVLTAFANPSFVIKNKHRGTESYMVSPISQLICHTERKNVEDNPSNDTISPQTILNFLELNKVPTSNTCLVSDKTYGRCTICTSPRFRKTWYCKYMIQPTPPWVGYVKNFKHTFSIM